MVSQWCSSCAAPSAPARQNFSKYKNNSAVKISLTCELDRCNFKIRVTELCLLSTVGDADAGAWRVVGGRGLRVSVCRRGVLKPRGTCLSTGASAVEVGHTGVEALIMSRKASQTLPTLPGPCISSYEIYVQSRSSRPSSTVRIQGGWGGGDGDPRTTLASA